MARAKVLGQALIGPVESHAHPYPVTVERGMFTSHGPALGHILTTTARIRISASNCMDWEWRRNSSSKENQSATARRSPGYWADPKNRQRRDFPGDPEVKNPPCNMGDASSAPGWGTKIPHAMEQLSLCAGTTDSPQLDSPHTTTGESMPRNKRSQVLQLWPSAAK